MQVYPLPSSLEAPKERQLLTCYLVNDTVAIDCGGLGFFGTPAQQQRVRHIVLSHTHMDHLSSLPMYLDNVYDGSGQCVTIHGTQTTLECLQTDLFNNRIWPDFIAISQTGPPFLKLQTMTPGKTFTLEGLRITPVPVNHVIECMGFLVEDDRAAIAFSSDTAPTHELWKRASQLANLKAVFLEATFPENMTRLAAVAKHLTPSQVAGEVAKMPPGIRVLAVHLQAKHRPQVVRELQAQNLPNLEIVEFGKMYEF